MIIQNDHKPLETILKKPLSQAPKRQQVIIMKLLRYDVEFQFMKGTDLVIADTLSRAYVEMGSNDETERLRICKVSVLKNFLTRELLK